MRSIGPLLLGIALTGGSVSTVFSQPVEVLQNGNTVGVVEPFQGQLDGLENFNKADPIIGPKGLAPGDAALFIYQGGSALSTVHFNFIAEAAERRSFQANFDVAFSTALPVRFDFTTIGSAFLRPEFIDRDGNGQADFTSLSGLFNTGSLIDEVLSTGTKQGYVFEMELPTFTSIKAIEWEWTLQPKLLEGIGSLQVFDSSGQAIELNMTDVITLRGVIPEPVSLLLLGGGIGALAFRRNRAQS